MPARTGTISSPIERPKWAGSCASCRCLCRHLSAKDVGANDRPLSCTTLIICSSSALIIAGHFAQAQGAHTTEMTSVVSLHAEGLTILSGLIELFHPAVAGLTINEHAFTVLNVVSKKIFCRRK